jgi:dihydroneopterin aldolase
LVRFAPESQVFVRGLTVRVDIGALASERNGPQDVRITVAITAPTITDHDDRLERIVPYHPVVEKVNRIISRGHINLVETLAQDIARSVLEDRRILKVEVTIEKTEIFANAESAGVTVVAYPD